MKDYPRRRSRDARPRRSLAPLVAVLSTLTVASTALHAGTTRQLNLLALERAAGSIFHGRCVERKEFPDATPVPYTEYRFEVLSAVKGCRDAGGKSLEFVTFRHVGTRRTFVRPDGTKAVPLRFGLPTYRVGEEAVLFLTRESRIGLCAPVGLGQGKFSVLRGEKDARVRVRNARANAGLFERVEAGAFEPAAEATVRETLRESARRPSRLELRKLLELCRKVRR